MNVQKNPVTENKPAADKFKDTYLHWTKAQLGKLRSCLCSLESEDIHNPDIFLAEVSDLTSNIKGLGGSFGYFLMTDIATSLCRYISDAKGLSTLHPQVIAAHIVAMDKIIDQEIDGTGGDDEARMVTSLYKMTEQKKMSI